MSAKDLYHDTVKTALIKDGWTITDDPMSFKIGGRDLFIDLGAEKPLLAERGSQKIAVEVKSFIGKSPVADLEQALGQYLLYEKVLATAKPEHVLYLAIRQEIHLGFFTEEIVQILLRSRPMQILVFDANQEVITTWIP
jgi:hypothetical protein